ncbi:MAG TPA: type IV toxin-antitoxin system AbiEi family antitoxin domain-containing protein [Acidimicrobiales bacterium]|jgi:very-short-patch-repair endonuclease
MQEEWLQVAAGQSGAISGEQLAAAGVTVGRKRALAAAGVLQKVRRGVYVLVGSDRDWRRTLWLGLLAGGDGAFACRRSAAALWDLDGVAPGFVDIGVPPGRHPRRPGTVRVGTILVGDLVRHEGVPTTSVARTLLDLGSVVDSRVVERSVECALRRRLVDAASLSGTAAAARSPGAGCLRQVLDQRPAGAPPTESDPETRFVQIARTIGLPDPRRQFVVILRGRKYRLDFAWPALRLAVEIDSISVHGPDRLGADLYRQNQIQLDGWLIVRFTRQMVVYDQRGVERDLRAAWELRSLAVWR